MPLSSRVGCGQVDRRRLGHFSLKSGHVSVPQRLAGLPAGLHGDYQGCSEWVCGFFQRGDFPTIFLKFSTRFLILFA